MTLEETKNIVDKIKMYRQSFASYCDKNGLDKLKLEWFKVLEPYDYQDINSKLEEFLKNGDNFGKYPDPYYLIKYLKTKDQKEHTEGINVRCQLCGKIVGYGNYQEHYDRCSSVEYLIKHSEKKLNREKLMNASKKEFDDYYYNFIENEYETTKDELKKHMLGNVVLTRYGHEPELNINEILQGGRHD